MKSFRQRMDTPTPGQRIVKAHYRLSRFPSHAEVQAEKDNILRRGLGNLDDSLAMLAAKLDIFPKINTTKSYNDA